MKKLLMIFTLSMVILTFGQTLFAFMDPRDTQGHSYTDDGHVSTQADSEARQKAVVTRKQSTDPKRAGEQADFYAKIRSGSTVSAAQSEIAEIIAAHRDVSIAFDKEKLLSGDVYKGTGLKWNRDEISESQYLNQLNTGQYARVSDTFDLQNKTWKLGYLANPDDWGGSGQGYDIGVMEPGASGASEWVTAGAIDSRVHVKSATLFTNGQTLLLRLGDVGHADYYLISATPK